MVLQMEKSFSIIPIHNLKTFLKYKMLGVTLLGIINLPVYRSCKLISTCYLNTEWKLLSLLIQEANWLVFKSVTDPSVAILNTQSVQIQH